MACPRASERSSSRICASSREPGGATGTAHLSGPGRGDRTPREGKLFVITGPSGVGKGTLIKEVLRQLPDLELSVSATTRPPREGERDALDYHFLDEQEFDRRLRAGDFMEHAAYSGHRYGTLRSEVEPRLERGVGVVLEIEVQGARQVRQSEPEAVLVFVAPPDPGALRQRLEGRGTDTAAQIDRRLEVAGAELEARREFRHVIVNDRVERAAAELAHLIEEEAGRSGS